eukprot:jgi/Astpho2/2370/Aster-05630
MARLFALTCLLVGLLCVTASSSEFHSEHVADLGDDFQEKISDGKIYLVKLYAPWRLADTWKKLGESYKDDSDIVIAHVDCTKAKSVCGKLEIRGYPTLQLFANGEKVDTYSGGRDIPSLKKYVDEQKQSLLHETTA